MDLYPKKFSRRHFLAIGGLGAFGYVRFGEPNWLDVSRVTARLSGTETRPPLTLLQLSDFHASDVVSLDLVERSVRLALNSCEPDLICLTGDFITWKWEQWDEYSAILSTLVGKAPTFARLGNHDGGAWAGSGKGYFEHDLIDKMLANAGVILLHNSSTVFEHDGWKLNIVGVGDWWADEMDPAAAYRTIDRARPTILLSHNPDTKTQLMKWPWDLMLSGHTHGGQLSLPGIGTPFAPIQDKRYVRGLHRWNNRWLHITKGVGNLHGMRFNCRPEVSVLTLT
jgi:predicted MPP superfamily phosphohydrolase